MGTASVAASAISPFIQTIRQPQTSEMTTAPITPTDGWLNSGAVFSISLIVGVLFSLLTWGLLAFVCSRRPQ